jgi:hypothetical protein
VSEKSKSLARRFGAAAIDFALTIGCVVLIAVAVVRTAVTGRLS